MDNLPTKAQISAIDDVASLKDIKDRVLLSIDQIEAQLEFSGRDEGWADRATNALALHRYTFRLLERRIAALGVREAKDGLPGRADAECHALTLEVLREAQRIDVGAIQSPEEADAKLAWLNLRIDAVSADREDEISLPAADRDEGFMAATGRLLRQMRQLRPVIQARRGELSKAAKKAHQATVEMARERLFIDMAREVLDRPTYLAIWDRVDALQAREAEKAA